MNKKTSLCLMCLGVVCILSAAGVLGYTQIQEKNAQSYSRDVAVVFGQEVQTIGVDGGSVAQATKVVDINGQEYMGMLLIPQLDLELPVATTFDYVLLQQTPCVFSGTMETNDLIVAAHNYAVHFGNIGQLELGDEIFLVDATGSLHLYSLQLEETLSGDDLSGLYAGEWDLSLFTCSHVNNSKRTVLRFAKVETK